MTRVLLLAFLFVGTAVAQDGDPSPAEGVAVGTAQSADAPAADAPAPDPTVDPLEAAPIPDSERFFMEIPLDTSGADAAIERARRNAQEQRRRTNQLLLGLVALLALWLFARNQLGKGDGDGRAAATRQGHAHRRRVALSHEELGHLVFEVARSHDLGGFRDLFLSGPEAAELLGPDAAAGYLEQRNDHALREALDQLAEHCPAGATFGGVEPVEGGLLGLRVKFADGTQAVLPVGTATQAGGGVRLHMPVTQLSTVTAAPV